MFKIAIAYLESKTPTWVKIIVALVVVGWMAPLKTRDWFYESIDTRVYAVLLPIRLARDYEIRSINDKITTLNTKADETNSFVKAIALEQLGAKRFEQISLTATGNTK